MVILQPERLPFRRDIMKARPAATLTEGSVFGGMMRFFLPIMLGTLLQQLYSTVDAVVLGQFVGKNALAAVGGSDMTIINLIVGFFVGLSSGASVVISQHYGAREDERVSSAVHTAIVLAIWIGAVMTLVGIFLAPALLGALDTPEEIMDYSIDYLQWYFAGMVPSMIYNMGSSILRAMGDSRRPLYFLVACTVINTILDLFFVAVLRLEVAGAAIATSVSQLICAGLVLFTLSRLPNSGRLYLNRLRADRTLLLRMLAMGLPAGIQSTLYSVTNLFVQRATNLLGTDTVAAWSAFWKLDGIFWPVSSSIGIAVMTFAGQNYGARRMDRIYRCIHTGLAMHAAFSVVFSLALYVTRGLTVRLFCSDPAVVEQGQQIVAMIAFAYPTFFCTEVFSSAMRGVGNAVKPTVITLFGVCVLRMILLFTVTFPHLCNETIAICYPITWAASSILFLLYYKLGKWMPNQAVQSQPETR